MARRRRAERRDTPPDPRFGSPELARFINRVMQRGKQTLAQRLVYTALDSCEKELKRTPLEVFHQVVKNVTPLLEVKPRRVGGATYQVPIDVRPERGEAMAQRWLIASARARSGMSMTQKLSAEFIEAYRGQGSAVKKREDLHKMAEANRAFVHYRW